VQVYEHLIDVAKRRGAGFLVLLDPDEYEQVDLVACAEQAELGGVDALLMGGSVVMSAPIDTLAREIKSHVNLPLIIFPGSADQLSRYADAVLFTSLLSGRNPAYLIGEQVKGAPVVRRYGLEAIPTGYLLIESGAVTSVQYLSDTQPIPRNKPDIVKAHALAAEYLGMKLVYLEAGSGARYSVPEELISATCGCISLPVVCGGGIRRPEDAARKVEAGAGFIVIGNRFQESNSLSVFSEFADAVHCKEAVAAKRIE
jgi:phosphoglycerol geranylgeranyltransferase